MPRTVQAIYPRDAYAASSYAKWFYLGAQNSGDIENKVAGKANASKHASFADATCWATAGYATVGGGGTNYATIPAATADLESTATHVLVVAARLKKVAVNKPAAEGQMFASYQPGSQYGGIIISMLTTGAMRLYVNAKDSTTVSLNTAADVLTTGAAAPEVSVVWIVDGALGHIGINGLEAVTGSSTAGVANKPLAGGRTARFGLSLPGSSQPDACGVASFQTYCVPRASTNINRLAVYDWIARNPHLPVPDWVWGTP